VSAFTVQSQEILGSIRSSRESLPVDNTLGENSARIGSESKLNDEGPVSSVRSSLVDHDLSLQSVLLHVKSNPSVTSSKLSAEEVVHTQVQSTNN